MLLRKEVVVSSPYGFRRIRVFCGDILEYQQTADILTLSAFERNYVPSRGTIIGALYEGRSISTARLAMEPKLDLREFCGCWVSRKIPVSVNNPNIRRIGCVELKTISSHNTTEILISRIQSYYQVLDILPLNNVSVRHVVMPFLGTGHQRTEPHMIVVPLISETLQYLRRSPYTEDITFIEHNQLKADVLVDALTQSYAVIKMQKDVVSEQKTQPYVFISYSSQDRAIADLLCQKLEENGIKVWYAPRNIHSGNYAGAIVEAISFCSHFITVISRNSMESEHVLNEVDLAFGQLRRGIVLLPFRVDDQDLRAEFNYYLKRQQWMEAQKPPMEMRIEEFIRKVFYPEKTFIRGIDDTE